MELEQDLAGAGAGSRDARRTRIVDPEELECERAGTGVPCRGRVFIRMDLWEPGPVLCEEHYRAGVLLWQSTAPDVKRPLGNG